MGEYDNRRKMTDFFGLVKCTDSERKMYPDMSKQSTHPQNVSKKPKIFDTSLWL